MMTVAKAIEILEKIRATHGDDKPLHFQIAPTSDPAVLTLDAIVIANDGPEGSTLEFFRDTD